MGPRIYISIQQWPRTPYTYLPMLDLTWVFKLFKISRADCSSDSDARNFSLRGNYFRHHNVKSRRDTTFSMPDLNLASTSASILKAGLHKVWRTTGKSKACSKPSQHGHIPQPESASILTHLPFSQPGKPERQPADTQHSPRSRIFHLHKAANKKPDSEERIVRFPNSVPNCLPIGSFGSSVVKGSERTQRNVGLNIFTAGKCSSSLSSFQVTFLPNTASPSRSLLFLPPTPPPRRKNSEEDTVPLPSPSLPGKFIHSSPFIFLIKIFQRPYSVVFTPVPNTKLQHPFPSADRYVIFPTGCAASTGARYQNRRSRRVLERRSSSY